MKMIMETTNKHARDIVLEETAARTTVFLTGFDNANVA